MASHLKDRTDNEIKNYWNTHLKKKLLRNGIDPTTHRPRPDLTLLVTLSTLLGYRNTNCGVTTPFNHLLQQQLDPTQFASIQLICDLIQVVAGTIQCGNTLSLPVHTPPVMDGFGNGEQFCGNCTLSTIPVVSSSSPPEPTNYSSATSVSVSEDCDGLLELDVLNGDIWWNDVLLDQ